MKETKDKGKENVRILLIDNYKLGGGFFFVFFVLLLGDFSAGFSHNTFMIPMTPSK